MLTLKEILNGIYTSGRKRIISDGRSELEKRMKRKENGNYADESVNSEYIKQQ